MNKKAKLNAKWVILSLMLMFSVFSAFAQSKVTGVVVDESGEGMPGVSVIIKGTTQGVVTDLDGGFTIEPQQRNAVLSFSFLGYVSQEVKATPGKLMRIVLLEDNQQLNEVVVVGYQEVRKRDLTGAVAKADVNALVSTPVSSFDQTLGGRLAGVNVSSSEGMPGGAMNIVIRGNNSLTQGNTPLYVIDGFPVEDPEIASSINPSDIASIDVLKDASASAIYGARGANGVVIVTTKSGQVGKPRIHYDGSIGWQTVTKKIPMMDAYQFVQLQDEMYHERVADTYLSLYENKQWTLDDYRNINQYNWQDMIFQTAPLQNHNVSLNGGSSGVRYNASLSYYDQDGVVLNSNYNRIQGRMGTTVTKKKLKINLNMNYSQTKLMGQSPSQTSYSGMNNLFYSVWGYRPVTQPALPLQSLVENATDEDVNNTNDYRFNPIMSLNNEYNKRMNTYIQFNGYLEYEFMKGLRLRVSGGYTDTRMENDNFNNSKTRYGGRTSTEKVNAQVTRSKRSTWLNENTLTYQTNFDNKHYLNTLLGFSLQNSDFESYQFKTINIPNDQLGMAGMSQGTPTKSDSRKSSWSMMSFFGRFNYNYMSRYYATFTMRADGSSKFRGNNRFGYFPSGSLAWSFTEEKFMKPISKVLNNGKLRLSWGMTGNNRVGEYDTYGIYQLLKDSQGNLVNLGSVPSGVYPFNNNDKNVGMVLTSIPNEDLKWETTEQWNLGVDLGFFNDRIGLTVDLYSKTTRDLLLLSSLPQSSGFISAMKNVGKVRNQGVEITLNTTNIKTKKFEWTSNFNIAFNKNKVLALSENQTSLLTAAQFDQNFNSQTSYIAKVGYPMGMMYGYIYDGTYKYDDFNKSGNSYTLKANVPHFSSEANTQPGMPKYRDINGDGTINTDDCTMIGNGLPVHTGGFTNNFAYAGFDLSIFFQWSYGNDILNANKLMFESSWNKTRDLNQFSSYADRWTETNPESNIPRATSSSSNKVFSSRIIEDGSFLRLKTVTFGYSLPNKWLLRYGIDQLRVYVAAQNLFTITGYDGYDPEVSIRDGALTPGLDFSAYPRARSFSFGINLGF
jgi:TonB-linked SusC/RagA family outer membrane protein